ncbi:MAG: hypothetical protein GY950_24205, partial [bacterium]|nr:hypothetical protein [bacterium]
MKKLFIFIILVTLGPTTTLPCTAFTANTGENNQRVLIGNNEDNSMDLTDTVVRIQPASQDKYGCLLVGFNRQNFSMGGMNDQGLFYDWFSVPECDWVNSGDKLPQPSWMPLEILETCANVEEAITFCHTYNLGILKEAQVLLVDKTGNSAIIAWGDGDIDVIRKEGNFQVITNFYINYPERGWYPCGRYDTAQAMLQNGVISIDLFRSILDNVHQVVSSGQTQYSNIYELQLGD